MPGEVLEVDRVSLQEIMRTDAIIGNILLSAFVQRRTYLIANAIGDAVLIGSTHSSDTLRLRSFARQRSRLVDLVLPLLGFAINQACFVLLKINPILADQICSEGGRSRGRRQPKNLGATPNRW
jgi:hypothetical protein